MSKEDGSTRHPDYSVLERPGFMNPIFHPVRLWTPSPAACEDIMVPVAEDVRLSARYYPGPEDSPNVLYFHGNGEIACQYDSIANIYSKIGIGLFVVDYRGYGKSDGSPTLPTMVSDAQKIYEFFQKKSQKDSKRGTFVMGRSLGCISALEVASQNPDSLDGLIVESGLANIGKQASRFGLPHDKANELSEAITRQVRGIRTPALIIHGERDRLIPPEVGQELYDNLGSIKKVLVRIPMADHNSVMQMDISRYFLSISDFVQENQPPQD